MPVTDACIVRVKLVVTVQRAPARPTSNRRARARARTRVLVAVGATWALAVAACGAPAPGPSRTEATSPAAQRGADQAAVDAAQAFLAGYVDSDGRTVRRDQGGDTVSEGQGYAMLLAVAIGDQRTFDNVWSWTAAHLWQPSGLFAYHWAEGGVKDPTPAADADLQTAWALALAGTRFHQDSYLASARKIADAIMAVEVARPPGYPVLAAGPWAVEAAGSAIVEPGYWTPPAAAALARLTADDRWNQLNDGAIKLLHLLADGGTALPPDWAHARGEGDVSPTSAPDGSAPIQLGPDGMRALIWSLCAPEAKAIAAGWWPLISATANSAPITRSLSGEPTSGSVSALSAVAAAAAARAAGDTTSSDRLLRRADEIADQYPTYYGSAWLALGRVLLTTTKLGTC